MRTRSRLVACLAACLWLGAGPLTAQKPGARAAALAKITAEGITDDIGVLADDSLRGRPTPSRELDAAAAYVAAQLRAAGVRPLPGRELVTRWPLINTTPLLDRITLRVRDGGRTGSLAYGTDFALMPGGPTPVTGRLVPVSDLSDSKPVRGQVPVVQLPSGGWSGTLLPWRASGARVAGTLSRQKSMATNQSARRCGRYPKRASSRTTAGKWAAP